MNASRSPVGRAHDVAASASGTGRRRRRSAARNTASTRAADALPPAPWARVTTSSVKRGRRRRKASMRSRTAASRSLGRRCRWLRHAPIARRAGPAPRAHRAKPSAACVSWMRWTLSASTTRQWCTSPLPGHLAAVVAGEADGQQARGRRPRRRRRAGCASCRWSTGRGRCRRSRPWAMSWREKTSSKPTSLPSAVSTAWSSTRQRAGQRPARGGWREQGGQRRRRRSSCRRCRT